MLSLLRHHFELLWPLQPPSRRATYLIREQFNSSVQGTTHSRADEFVVNNSSDEVGFLEPATTCIFGMDNTYQEDLIISYQYHLIGKSYHLDPVTCPPILTSHV